MTSPRIAEFSARKQSSPNLGVNPLSVFIIAMTLDFGVKIIIKGNKKWGKSVRCGCFFTNCRIG